LNGFSQIIFTGKAQRTKRNNPANRFNPVKIAGQNSNQGIAGQACNDGQIALLHVSIDN
jgi:hypothetical protein